MHPNEDAWIWMDDSFIEQDSSLISNEDDQPEEAHAFLEDEYRNNEALESMERLVLELLDQLSRSSDPFARGYHNVDGRTELTGINLQIADRRRPRQDGKPSMRTIRFPQNKRRGNARSFATLFRVIEISHEGIVRGTSATKRDIYYNDVGLFQSQSTVNKLVDDLAATWGVARSHLNITAASKGLWCGAGLSMITKSGSLIPGQNDEANLIPAQENIEHIRLCEQTAWILVVEKDAVFQTLCRAGLTTHSALHGPGIIVTGKGYPDIATRELVSTLSRSTTIPLLALVDCDPHGVDIFSCYKHGSKSLQHEQERLRAHRLQWIGVLSSDLNCLDNDDLLPLSAHDHLKALALLRSSPCRIEPLWRREISRMLHTRRKAEVEIMASRRSLDGSQDSLLEYVLAKIVGYCRADRGWEDFTVLDM